MKSAEQWTAEIYSEPTSFVQSEIDRQTVAKIRAIQLDAMKEGARRAAKKCEKEGVQYHPVQWEPFFRCQKSILTAAEQWTEADL